ETLLQLRGGGTHVLGVPPPPRCGHADSVVRLHSLKALRSPHGLLGPDGRALRSDPCSAQWTRRLSPTGFGQRGDPGAPRVRPWSPPPRKTR
ncbi:unnamed protein product, partial [Merluccius merluccius]